MFKNQKIKVTHFVIAALTLLAMFSCAKDQNSFVPYVPVDFYIPLATNNHLTIPGNSIMFRGYGYAGVIVICVNPSEYHAYDACCSFETLKTCSVEVTPLSGLSSGGIIFSSDVSGKCKCCGSEYNLFGGGFVTKGPSSHGMQQYQVSVISDRLWIHN
jgi:nitrite reductase/ring-hydroxylating ferredoxin subunit